MTGKSEKDMVIYLTGERSPLSLSRFLRFDELTPREIVVELDKYIVGTECGEKGGSYRAT